MNISKQLSMLPTYEGLNGQSVIGQGLIVKFTMEANSNVFKNSLIFWYCFITYIAFGVRKQLCLPNYNL